MKEQKIRALAADREFVPIPVPKLRKPVFLLYTNSSLLKSFVERYFVKLEKP